MHIFSWTPNHARIQNFFSEGGEGGPRHFLVIVLILLRKFKRFECSRPPIKILACPMPPKPLFKALQHKRISILIVSNQGILYEINHSYMYFVSLNTVIFTYQGK